jgi:hypothetical protein
MDDLPQFDAARDGDLKLLRVALTRDNVDVVDTSSRLKWTSLFYAVNNVEFDCVMHCLQMGANVNIRDVHGSTPLHYVSGTGDLPVFHALLDAGAIIDTSNNDGMTPLSCALRYKRVGVARILIDRGAKLSNAKLDAATGIPDWVYTFIESRSNCRSISIIVIGIQKYHRTKVTCNNDINIMKLIGKHIWSCRNPDDLWTLKRSIL